MESKWKPSLIVKDVPRKGYVDRNASELSKRPYAIRTFPARGTWIEIILSLLCAQYSTGDVPRKGNVDRNATTSDALVICAKTFPARGTWIEIRN